METMKEEILDGPRPLRITETKRLDFTLSSLKEWKCALRNLYQSTLNTLGRELKTYLEKDLLQSKYPNLGKGKVYDILNVESTSRFVALDGQIYHNCLGISYLMSKYGLAVKLTQDTGIYHSPDDAQEMIDKFNNSFSTFTSWQQELLENYYDGEYIQLSDGWTVFKDAIEENFRSIANSRVQGQGGTIMRESDFLAYEKGLYVPFTLHDALYIEYDLNDFSAIDKLYDAMVEGFVKSFPDQAELAKKIKLDISTWSEEYEDGKVITTPAGHKIKLKKLYIDKRAVEYYNKYKYYLEHDITEL